MRVLFWGTPSFAVPALAALAEEGHDVVGVVTQPDRPAGRGRTLGPSPIKTLAVTEGITIFQPERAHDPEFVNAIRGLGAEISIVVAYGQILKSEVLQIPELGSLNIHASLLPELRGAAPIHWAIIRGFDQTGVSIMQMDEGLDTGPVLYTVDEPIRPDESMCELSERLSEIGAEAMVETLALLEDGALQAVPQDEARATYAPKLDRETAHLDWTLSARDVARWIRGLDDVPGAWSTVGQDAVKVFAPKVEAETGNPGEVLRADPEKGILVGAGTDAIWVGEVQPPGKRRMTSAEWVRGRGIKAGDRLD